MSLGRSGGEAFRLGYIAGLAHHLTALSWLLYIPVPVAPIVGWMALSAYVALYPAGWVWFAWRIFPGRFDDAGPGWMNIADRFLATRFARRALWSLSCAAAWVALEMLRARLFSGFPWNLLGDSQYRLLPTIQISAFTGVYGVSFLMAWFSVALLGALMRLAREPQKHRTWAGEVLVPGLVVALVTGYGLNEMLAVSPDRSTLKVALVQPSIPQRQIWDERESGRRFQQLLALSEQALIHRPQLLIWPEAGVPSLLRWDTNLFGGVTLYDAVTNLVRRHQVWLILGADDAEPNALAPGGADFFNSSFLIDPQGSIVSVYRKQRLVIFGEYVPLAGWFPFLRRFTGVGGDFTPGKAPVTFGLPELGVQTSALICFEDVFPHGVRQHGRDELDFLVNITNDGWFGESAAQWQQAASAVFRAVENGLPLIRCANNGLTCWIDAQGRMSEVYFPGTQDIYRAGFKIAEVPVWPTGGPPPTFYRRRGDVFGWGCVIAVLLRWAIPVRMIARRAD
jgi:apolipoprotein N-acyltransferase